MKIIFLFFLLIPLAVHADMNSEAKALDEFYQKEYMEIGNYFPSEDKYYFPLKPLFTAKLLKNTKHLKYFLISSNFDKWLYKYKNDKAFTLFWETKFSGKPLTVGDKTKIYDAIGNFILKDPDLSAQKLAIKDRKESEVYLQKVLTEISKQQFK